ncbi:MAG: hypothetical protein K8M05_02995 [Deltaproteobacteria bacterium]|nr:hypothetical protein [Kofleriaceae bacterium]
MQKKLMKPSPLPATHSTEDSEPAVRVVTANELRSVSGGLSFTTKVNKASPKL